MTYERFLKVILTLKKESEKLSQLYSNDVDLINFVDGYHIIIAELLKEIYGDDGYDKINWYCYENLFGLGGLEMWDEDGKPICYSLVSLWRYLEDNHIKK